MNEQESSSLQKNRFLDALGRPAPLGWVVFCFFCCYIANLAFAKWIVAPDFIALRIIYWLVYQPRQVGLTVAFVMGLLMDVHNGSVLGQHPLVYVCLAYCALLLHRRLPWFGLIGQARHVIPLLFRAQCIAFLFRFWFDNLSPEPAWFIQCLTGGILWPCAVYLFSRRFTYNHPSNH